MGKRTVNLANTQPTIREWLTAYIASAFRGVTLGDGIDIHTASDMDDYGCNINEQRLAEGCQRGNWHFVDPQLLRERAWSLTFLDSIGLRFYLPVMMSDIILGNDSELHETLFYRMKTEFTPRHEGTSAREIYNPFQLAAIRRFLKYMINNKSGLGDRAELKSLLRSFEACCR